MIKKGVSQTVGRRLNYSERSGKVVVTRHQSNSNRESAARVMPQVHQLPIRISCVPLLVATLVARAPCELPQAHQLPILTSLLILITFSWKQEHYSDSRPPYRLSIFDGNPVDYRSFIRAFESLIESRTCSSTERLYYLEKYTTRDVKELTKSCHHLPPDVGYEEARKLLKKRFGDEYRVSSAHESKFLAWPPKKAEDGTVLNNFAIFLSSCKNALAGSQASSRFDKPVNSRKLIFKLPLT